MDDIIRIHEDRDTMKIANRFFEKHAQQSVMTRVANLPVFARTGPSSKSSKSINAQKEKGGEFIVGVSEVGGTDKVKGTP